MVMIFCEYVVIMLIRSEIGMKKKTMFLLTAVLCASVGALVMFLNRPY